MFKKLTPSCVKNEEGIVVDYRERHCILYRANDKTLIIPREVLLEDDNTKPTDNIFLDRVSRWEPPNDNEVISLEERAKIKHNLTEALVLMGCRPHFKS